MYVCMMGRNSAVVIASPYFPDGLGSSPGDSKVIRTRLDRPWDPPILPYDLYRVASRG